MHFFYPQMLDFRISFVYSDYWKMFRTGGSYVLYRKRETDSY